MIKILTKLSEIFSEAKGIKKDMTVGKGANSYEAVSEEAVLNATRSLFIKYKVLMIPVDIKPQTQYTENIISDNYGQKVKSKVFTEIIVTYKLFDSESGESISCQGIGHGIDSGDKASGKALTYADKNALIRLFKLYSGVDTDNTHSEDHTKTQIIDNTHLLDDCIDLMDKCKSLDELQEVFTKYSKQLKKYRSFVAAKDRNKQRLISNT